jgi:hypothetical protein
LGSKNTFGNDQVTKKVNGHDRSQFDEASTTHSRLNAMDLKAKSPSAMCVVSRSKRHGMSLMFLVETPLGDSLLGEPAK